VNQQTGDRVATAIRTAAAGAAKNAIDRFASASILALGQAATTLARDHATIGADAIAETLVGACATNMVGRIVSDLDAKGFDAGDVHVSTQLAAFASGGAVKSPIENIEVEHRFPFALGGGDGLEAGGSLTLHATCALDDAADELQTSAWGKLELKLSWSSEKTQAGAAP
jgi:arginase family enzyme